MTVDAPYRNQAIGLQGKSMEWFLYKRDLPHKRVKFYEFQKQPFRIMQNHYTADLTLTRITLFHQYSSAVIHKNNI